LKNRIDPFPGQPQRERRPVNPFLDPVRIVILTALLPLHIVSPHLFFAPLAQASMIRRVCEKQYGGEGQKSSLQKPAQISSV